MYGSLTFLLILVGLSEQWVRCYSPVGPHGWSEACSLGTLVIPASIAVN